MAGYKFEEFIEKLVDCEAIDYENPTAFIIQNLTNKRDSIGDVSKLCEVGRKGALRVLN